jgi:hypothetical protein
MKGGDDRRLRSELFSRENARRPFRHARPCAKLFGYEGEGSAESVVDHMEASCFRSRRALNLDPPALKSIFSITADLRADPPRRSRARFIVIGVAQANDRSLANTRFSAASPLILRTMSRVTRPR